MARSALLWAGIGCAVAGVAVGVGSVAVASSTTNATVERFARAPVGCTTTLEFDTATEFTFFVETRGRTDDLGGDCAGNGISYDRGDDDPPRVELTLVSDDGGQMALEPSEGVSYDTADFAGTSMATVDIETTGTYRLTVASDETDFAIAVGRDPSADALLAQALGAALAVLLFAAGVVLIVVGVRARRSPPAAPVASTPAGGTPMWTPPPPAAPWQPATPAPPAPPAAPQPGAMAPGSPLPPPPPPA